MMRFGLLGRHSFMSVGPLGFLVMLPFLALYGVVVLLVLVVLGIIRIYAQIAAWLIVRHYTKLYEAERKQGWESPLPNKH